MSRFGSYEILAPLAVGGTAEVFLAQMVGAPDAPLVVVKQLLPGLAEDKDFKDMFLDEARLGSHLTHDNVARTLDQGIANGRAFLAMEYLAGLTLGKLAIDTRKRLPTGLPTNLCVAIARDACHGLHHAHEAKLPDGTWLKIVHRDVSPQNIIVTFYGDVKIVDFGIAHAAVREARTKTGMVKGKFAYMAPEQCLGSNVDRRTDIFSMGVVLWELLTGKRLFKRKTSYETYQAILRGEVRSPDTDPALDAIVLRALSREPSGRHHTAAELAGELDAWLRGRGVIVGAREIATFYQQAFDRELSEHRAWISKVREGKVTAAPDAETWTIDDAVSDAQPAPDPLKGHVIAGPEDPTAYVANPDERTTFDPVNMPAHPEAQPFLMVPVSAPAGRWKLYVVAGLFVAAVAALAVLAVVTG